MTSAALSETTSKDVVDRLGPRLIENGILDPAALERAVRLEAESQERLDQVLVKLALVSERDLAHAFSTIMDLPLAKADDYPAAPLLQDTISSNFLKAFRAIPLAQTGQHLDLAIADPVDSYARDAIALGSGLTVRPWVGLPADIDAALERLYDQPEQELLDEVEGSEVEDTRQDIERLKDSASEAPVVRFVDQLVRKAVEMGASDVHVEPFENWLRLRYRIDGVLREAPSPPARLRSAILSRIKIMARLDIAETRLPQDGRIRLAVRGRDIDLRVSTVPTMHGECAVLRILDREAVALDFERLGLSGKALQRYLRILERPHGILLVTGPTGSGKTTTLYTSLVRLNNGEQKILTVEDPIEYQLDGINQAQIQPQIGLTFAQLLRAYLRQDPDILMIGEIRDLETAEIAVQAALTGHLVLSTLHTNNAATTVTRLLDMGIEGHLLASTLNGVSAQRLVRTLCTACRRSYKPSPDLIRQLGLVRLMGNGAERLYRAGSCNACAGTGYRGRTSINETLEINDRIRDLVVRSATAQEIEAAAVTDGMRSLYEDGLAAVAKGATSVEEVLRVTREG